MAKSKFADQFAEFARKAKLRQEAVFRASAQALMDEANTPEGQGGKLPVDTGNLRNSALASKNGMPGSGAQPYSLVFAAMKVGEVVYAGWATAYALRQEHGFVGEDSLGRKYNQAGKGFMRSSAQNWDFHVANAIAKAKAEIP